MIERPEPLCPCGEIPDEAMFRRPNGACSACGKQVPDEEETKKNLDDTSNPG